eukprot:scaffold102957_cov31-Tisochrysis_lutea.AAC.2
MHIPSESAVTLPLVVPTMVGLKAPPGTAAADCARDARGWQIPPPLLIRVELSPAPTLLPDLPAMPALSTPPTRLPLMPTLSTRVDQTCPAFDSPVWALNAAPGTGAEEVTRV